MTVTTKVFVEGKFLENVQTTQYTPLNAKALIDKVSVTNTTAANVTLSINIVVVAGSASAANRFISLRSIAPGETYSCPEITGQVLESGDFISTLAGTASALSFRLSGREIT